MWTRRRALDALLPLLRRGITSAEDGEELIELLPKALGLSGVGFIEDWSYVGWSRVVGVDPEYGRRYEQLRDQDRSNRVLRDELPGTVWTVRRDAPPADYRTELYRNFDHFGLRDLALFRLPNALFGNLVGCFYRHKGLSDFDADDHLLFELLMPHLAAALGTRRALQSISGDSTEVPTLKQVRGVGHVGTHFRGERNGLSRPVPRRRWLHGRGVRWLSRNDPAHHGGAVPQYSGCAQTPSQPRTPSS